MRRWSHRLSEQSAEFAKLYLTETSNQDEGGRFTSPSAVCRSPISCIDRLTYRGPPPKLRKRRRDSYDSTGSFVASNDDNGEEVDHIRTVPSTKKIKRKAKGTVHPQTVLFQKRVDRILLYAESYKGWSTGVVRHFSDWVLEHELKSVSSSLLRKQRPLLIQASIRTPRASQRSQNPGGNRQPLAEGCQIWGFRSVSPVKEFAGPRIA